MSLLEFFTCEHTGGVLGIDLFEVPTMLSQGENFTTFNTGELKNMVSIMRFCTIPPPIFK